MLSLLSLCVCRTLNSSLRTARITRTVSNGKTKTFVVTEPSAPARNSARTAAIASRT